MAFDATLRFPTGWALIKVTDPDASFANDIAYTSSVEENVWSSQSVAIFKFAPMLIGSPAIHQQLVLGRIGVAGTILTTHSDLAQGTTVGGKSGHGERFEYSSDPEVSTDQDCRLRCKFIYSDFDILAQTWNNRGDLDESISSQLLNALEIDYNVGTFIGGSRTHLGVTSDEFIDPNQIEGPTWFPHSSKTTDLLALAEPGIQMRPTSGKTQVFGITLEIRPRSNRDDNLSLSSAWLGLQPSLAPS